MNVKAVAELLALEVQSEAGDMEKMVTGGYVSDMLSDVIANCKQGNVWITLQIHQNIVAVATLKELACIIVIGGKTPSADTVAKAKTEGVNLFTSPVSAFKVAGKLYQRFQEEG